MVKNLPAMQEIRVHSPGWEDPLEKEMATHSNILAGEFHGQQPDGLPSMGSRRVWHDWATNSLCVLGQIFLQLLDLVSACMKCGDTGRTCLQSPRSQGKWRAADHLSDNKPRTSYEHARTSSCLKRQSTDYLGRHLCRGAPWPAWWYEHQPTLCCVQADTVTSILNFHLLFAPLHKPCALSKAGYNKNVSVSGHWC